MVIICWIRYGSDNIHNTYHLQSSHGLLWFSPKDVTSEVNSNWRWAPKHMIGFWVFNGGFYARLHNKPMYADMCENNEIRKMINLKMEFTSIKTCCSKQCSHRFNRWAPRSAKFFTIPNDTMTFSIPYNIYILFNWWIVGTGPTRFTIVLQWMELPIFVTSNLVFICDGW